jgi:DNA-binding transcriptional LysR family regulator
VRDLPANREVPLGTYQRLHEPRQADRRVLLKVLRGLSCLACAECAEAVAAGLGIALLSRHALRMELALWRLVVLDVKGLPLRRQWYVVHRQDKRLSRAAVAFKAFLLTSAESVLASPRSLAASNRPARS